MSQPSSRKQRRSAGTGQAGSGDRPLTRAALPWDKQDESKPTEVGHCTVVALRKALFLPSPLSRVLSNTRDPSPGRTAALPCPLSLLARWGRGPAPARGGGRKEVCDHQDRCSPPGPSMLFSSGLAGMKMPLGMGAICMRGAPGAWDPRRGGVCSLEHSPCTVRTVPCEVTEISGWACFGRINRW